MNLDSDRQLADIKQLHYNARLSKGNRDNAVVSCPENHNILNIQVEQLKLYPPSRTVLFTKPQYILRFEDWTTELFIL